MAEWYLAGARAADLLLTRYRRRPPDRFTYLSSSVVTFADRIEALDWLERERTNLVAVVVATAEMEPEVALRIAYAMWPLFHLRRHQHDRMIVDQVAVECARRLGDRDFEARMLRRLAFAHFDLGQWEEAGRLYQASLGICTEMDDRYGIAASIEGIGRLALARGQFTLAAEWFTQELAMYQALGDRRREALATINLGVASNGSGQPAQAVPWLVRAKSLLTALGDLDPYNAARARLELGKALTGTGDHAAAARELDEALSDMRLLGSTRGQAHAHHALAVLSRTTGRNDAARAHLNLALDLYERLRDPAVAEVRQLVGSIPATDPDPHRLA
jgi:tetratricopeptide (TPR) repeat protein